MLWHTGYRVPQASRGPTGVLREPSSGEMKQDDRVGSWSLRRPSAEVVTSVAGPSEEALERRTRSIHCERPCGSPGAMGRCL